MVVGDLIDVFLCSRVRSIVIVRSWHCLEKAKGDIWYKTNIGIFRNKPPFAMTEIGTNY